MILKCKMCGGELEITEETSVCECEYCGSKQTIPTVDDEKIMKLYDRANRLRMANEFDKAAGVYESIIAESDTEAEAYWGLLLCKFGIEYVDDPATGDKVPTCHRSSFDSIMEDSDFEMVMENADGISRNVYREQAKQIEEIRKGIIEVSGKEEPYDIFICYKETAEDGDRTIDSVMAQNIYDQLTAKGYRVFFSRITLEDKLGQEYEPYIFAALNSAKIMLAFGTTYDYYNAVWVKNEWSRYLKLMAKDKSKKLIPCYKGIDAYDIPKEFKHLQAQDMGKVGADQDLIRGIDKILRPEGSGNGASANASASHVQDIQAMVANAVAANTGSNMNTLLERGFMTLEDGDFDKADSLFEDVLNQDPKCAEAYMGKLLAYYQATNTKSFANKIFSAIFSKSEEIQIELEYDIQDLLKNHYSLFNKISEKTMKLIKKAFDVRVETNIVCLNQYDTTRDYIEKYCALDNNSVSSSEQDDKYYQRYLQYATEEIHNRFNIHNLLQDMVVTAKATEEKKVQEVCDKYSKDNVMKLIEASNAKIKSIVGDEIDQIEVEFKSDFLKWQRECEEITRDWPTKRQEIQLNWKAECDAIKQKYKQDKKVADENNQKIKQAYQQAVSQYKTELAKIDNQISSLNSELAGLGLFKGKQKEAINNNIMILESKKNSLQKPELASFGKIMTEPRLVLPEQPEDSDTPILPTKPIRKELNQVVDAEGILIDEFGKEDIILGWRIIELGSYKGNPITWIMLKKKEGKALLLSEKVLDVIPYNKELEKTTWEQCTLRTWLNNDFLDETLGNEKNKVCMTKVAADANPKYDTDPGNDTEDKIFCLSINEVNEFFSEDEDRVAIPTEYAKGKVSAVGMKYFLDESSGGGRWWLRSPGRDGRYAADVVGSGWVDADGRAVPYDAVGIRPALWLNLDS